MSYQQRSPDQIRESIQQNRGELARSLVTLRSEVVAIADWRAQINRNRSKVITGAAVAGFVVGGGIAAMFARRRR